MGWSEFDEQEAREIQARVDAETHRLEAQIAALTKERDHWREANRNSLLAAAAVIEIERQRVRDALESLPSADTALQQRLAEERERCADRVDDREMFGGAATVIRSLK